MTFCSCLFPRQILSVYFFLQGILSVYYHTKDSDRLVQYNLSNAWQNRPTYGSTANKSPLVCSLIRDEGNVIAISCTYISNRRIHTVQYAFAINVLRFICLSAVKAHVRASRAMQWNELKSVLPPFVTPAVQRPGCRWGVGHTSRNRHILYILE